MPITTIWDYLPAYNTFFILIAKVYIAVIILTVIGYLAYLGYQKYMVHDVARPSSQASKTEPSDNKSEHQKVENKTDQHVIYVLWTGDMASTYTIINALIQDDMRVVQPVYIPKSGSPAWSKLEKLCMADLRKLITKRIPTARARLLPIMNVSPDLDDKAFTEVFRPKFAKLPQAVQSYYPLIQWAYYYKIREPVLVSGFPVAVADTDLVNRTSIESKLWDATTGKPVTAKKILSMARESRIPFADIMHKTCTCWQVGKARCGECKGCLVIKAIQKRLIK
jgi:hypothetical protein